MSTATANDFDMACPTCGVSDQIDVAATIFVRLVPGGTDPDAAHNHDHEWDDDSSARCGSCGHTGKVKEFRPGA